MDIKEEEKRKVLSGLPEAYRRYTMSGLSNWIKEIQGAEARDYAQRVRAYLEKRSMAVRVWDVDSQLVEEILKKV